MLLRSQRNFWFIESIKIMKVKKLRGCLSFEQKCDKVTIASHLWIISESEKSFRTEGAKVISVSALEIVLNNMLQTSFVREYPSRGPCIGYAQAAQQLHIVPLRR